MKDADNPEESEDDAKLPLDEKMLSYVDRIKIKSRDLPRTAGRRQAKDEMLKILIEKKIDTALARKAVEDTLDAAADHRLARLRHAKLQAVQQYSLTRLDELVEILKRLANEVSALPPDSKGDLNLNLGDLRKEGKFDTEMFFAFIHRLEAQLPNVSPRVRASRSLGIIVSEGETLRGSWEAMPASTRFHTERKIEALRRKTSLELLRLMPLLLEKFRPSKPIGAPPSLDFRFVNTVDDIWQKLQPPGRRQYRGLNGRHADGPFHRFCNAAFRGVGNAGEISSNQLSKLKRKRVKRVKPPLSG
jgi:hypothetical protein